MSTRSLRISAVIALFCVFLIAQLHIEVSSAGGDSNGVTGALPQKAPAILTIWSNEPISVNGASVITGATILSGATIETPKGVGAAVKLGSLGTLDIGPTSTLTLDFDRNSNVTVTLIHGCVILRTKKNLLGEIDTPQGIAGKMDPKTGAPLHVCFPQSTGTETGAGAGAAVEAVGGGGLLPLGKAAVLAIIAGRIGAGMGRERADRGRNPGPSAP